MKNIFKIFGDDIKSIVTHFFVFVIIIAIGILPALYAWVNIYANQDPYKNTGNIPFAVASRDTGIELENGKYKNSAAEIADSLKGSDSIDWKIIDSADEAIAGVESGKYYAAVIFEDGFTYDLYHFEEAIGIDEPPITYYTNTKKNSVAAKITDTAASTLQQKINAEYLQTGLSKFLGDAKNLSKELDTEEAADNAIKELKELRDSLAEYDKAIDGFTGKSEAVRDALSSAEQDLKQKRSEGSEKIGAAKSEIEETKTTIKTIKKDLDGQYADLKKKTEALESAVAKLQNASDDAEKEKLAKDAREKAERVLSKIEEMKLLIPKGSSMSGARTVLDTLELMTVRAEEAKNALADPSGAAEAMKAVEALHSMRKEQLQSSIDTMIRNLKTVIKLIEPLLSSAGGALDDIGPVFDAAGNTVGAMDVSLTELQKIIRDSESKLDDVIEKAEKAKGDDRLSVLMDFFGGDPDEYGEFFSTLVDVDVEAVYPVKRYGDAMTPFYSVLAIWVGGVMLVSLLKTNVNRKKYPKLTEAQGFFGRSLIFILLGQVQAAVIVLGDIFLLGCNPVHPWLMWLAAAAASLAFTMLIYALTLSFGDIGKAIVVIIMVLQIAGSSGSFPIEILPEIFGKIYRFFPFPYAINAMREAMFGTYGNEYAVYLAELSVFLIAGILIGLLVRRPFIGVNRFVTEKLEETEVL